MALVVWVYAGGGEAEVMGIIPFLQRHFNSQFERRTPRPKPGPRPGILSYDGHTGKSLATEIRKDITNYWDGTANVILVLDDTDDCDPETRETELMTAVYESLKVKTNLENNHPIVIALAVPELEIWLLADWNNTFKKYFSNCEWNVRQDLSNNRRVDFELPESFIVKDNNGEYHKISEIIKETIRLHCGVNTKYSKATDTPKLLLNIDPKTVSSKCLYFRKWWNALKSKIQ